MMTRRSWSTRASRLHAGCYHTDRSGTGVWLGLAILAQGVRYEPERASVTHKLKAVKKR
jgi:hypothetical protein